MPSDGVPKTTVFATCLAAVSGVTVIATELLRQAMLQCGQPPVEAGSSVHGAFGTEARLAKSPRGGRLLAECLAGGYARCGAADGVHGPDGP